MRIIKLILILLLIPSWCWGTVIFSENFDSWNDWTITQPTGSTESCDLPTNCGLQGDWTGYYNGACLLDGVSGEPGNNLMYVNSVAGYPDASTDCYGATGKCFTYWTESGLADFADGQLSWDTQGTEYNELYIRMRMKWPSGFEYKDEQVTKIMHIQHYLDGSPHAYHGVNPGNQPVSVGLFTNYLTQIQIYFEARCQTTYYCHSAIPFNIGTAAQIFDGNWHTIEMHFVNNSEIGVADGMIELWFDGVKKSPVSGYNNTDIEWNDTGSSELRGFRWFNIGGNTNNYWDTSCSNMADCEQWYAFDDICISDSYIGETVCSETPDVTSPTLNSKIISSVTGTTLTLSYSENVTQGAGYADADINVDCSTGGNDIALTYVSGNGTNTHIYTLGTAVLAGETCNIDFNGDANSLEDGAGNDLAAIVSGAMTNNSTKEIVAPVISGGSPSGIQSCTSDPRSVTIQVSTDEAATCKYHTSDVAYASMGSTFTTTGSTTHQQILTGLACDASYSRFVRCIDAQSNANSSSTEISFSIAPAAVSTATVEIGAGVRTMAIGAGASTIAW